MNKEIFNQLPGDERPVAAKLNSISENMKVPQSFQWTLESQLMKTYQKKSQPTISWFSKITSTAGWAALAIGGFILLSWGIRSLVPYEQITPGASNSEASFETQVRQGDICEDTIAVSHGFSISLSNQDKSGFIALNEDKVIGELRSFAWSPNGSQLAVIGNTTGNGNIYVTGKSNMQLQPVIANSELGYLMGVEWSHDGTQFVIWSPQNNTKVSLVNTDGTGLQELELGMQLFGTPQFTPDNQGIIFYGADTSSFGLFKFIVKNSQIQLISNRVEDETGFAWSPDGTQLAYFDMDRELGEARLIVEEFASGTKSVLGTLPIPQGSGSSIPDAANLSWSQDGTKLIFEFGRNAANRAIHLAYVDGSGLVKVIDSAYSPTISADGKCLAYISNKQVFITDLSSLSITPTTPMLLADLPPRKGTSDFRLDKLQWSP